MKIVYDSLIVILGSFWILGCGKLSSLPSIAGDSNATTTSTDSATNSSDDMASSSSTNSNEDNNSDQNSEVANIDESQKTLFDANFKSYDQKTIYGSSYRGTDPVRIVIKNGGKNMRFCISNPPKGYDATQLPSPPKTPYADLTSALIPNNTIRDGNCAAIKTDPKLGHAIVYGISNLQNFVKFQDWRPYIMPEDPEAQIKPPPTVGAKWIHSLTPE